jgi:hypothetical protein
MWSFSGVQCGLWLGLHDHSQRWLLLIKFITIPQIRRTQSAILSNMLCATCTTLLDNLEPKVFINHHKSLCDIETSQRSRCSWCYQLWQKCKPQHASPRNITCDLHVILHREEDGYILNFCPGGSADSEFTKIFRDSLYYFNLIVSEHDSTLAILSLKRLIYRRERQKLRSALLRQHIFSRKLCLCCAMAQ